MALGAELGAIVFSYYNKMEKLEWWRDIEGHLDTSEKKRRGERHKGEGRRRNEE